MSITPGELEDVVARFRARAALLRERRDYRTDHDEAYAAGYVDAIYDITRYLARPGA